MRLVSFAKTWLQYVNTDPAVGATKSVTRRFKTVWTDGRRHYSSKADIPWTNWGQLPGKKIIVPSWWNHKKNEPSLKPGEKIEGVEWSSRVGSRWCCRECDCQGPKIADGIDALRHADCHIVPDRQVLSDFSLRGPQRGVFARHIETTIVRLGDDDGCGRCAGARKGIVPSLFVDCRQCGGGGSAEAAREGFPGLSWAQFLERCFPKVPVDAQMARIHFERIDS